MDEDQQYDELYKVVLVGDAGVGKTNMLAFFTGTRSPDEVNEDGVAPTFHAMRKPTIGVEFGTRIIEHPDGVRIKAQIWDTAGQERYRAITSSHYRRAAGALLVYDVQSKKTFENAKHLWLRELRDSADEDSGLLSCVMLVGNKIDLEKSADNIETFVQEKEHTAACNELSLLSNRTSAKTGQGVEKAFKDLIIRIYDMDKAKAKDAFQSGGMTVTDMGTSGGKKGCC